MSPVGIKARMQEKGRRKMEGKSLAINYESGKHLEHEKLEI
jgi:hypothetical protein